MKKLLLTLFCIFSMFAVKAQCDYTLEMNDSWGDGWNDYTTAGASNIDVWVGGVEVLSNQAHTSGYQTLVTFSVNTGDDIYTVWQGGGTGSGGYEEEISYRILDSNGVEVASVNPIADGDGNIPTGTLTGSCPSCGDASATISLTSTTGATATWGAATGAASYDWEVVPTGNAQGTGVIDSGAGETGLSATITGLTFGSTYDFLISSDCTTDYASAVTFTVDYCTPGNSGSSVVYISDVTTTSNFTDIDNSGSGYSPGGYGDFSSQSISGIWPEESFDLTVTNNYGVGRNIYVDWNNDLTFDETAELVGSGQAFPSETYTITIPANQAVGDYRMRIATAYQAFVGPCSTTSFYGEHEDYTISVVATPSCADAAANISDITQTGATATWDAALGASSYDWEVVPTGNAQGTGVLDSGSAETGLTVSFTGLTPETSYDFLIRSDCKQSYASAVTFTTLCNTLSLPFSQGMDNTGATPECWTQFGAEDWLFQTSGPNHVGNAGTISGSTDSGTYYAVVDASGTEANAILVSPHIDLSSLTTPMLTFYEISDNEDGANSLLTVDVYDGAAWNTVGTYNSNTANGAWEKKEVVLDGLTFTGDARVRFTFTEPVDDFKDDIAIDDVSFIEAPSCANVSGVTTSIVTSTSVDVAWTETGTATDYNIEVYEAGADTTTATAVYTEVVVGATSTTVTGLTTYSSYDIYVQADCGFTGTSDFIMASIYMGHCIPSTTNTQVGIDNVTTTGGTTNISNTSSGLSPGGYGDFKDQSITGLYGTQSFTITLDEGVLVGGKWYGWVDWNNDLVFDNTAGSSEIAFVLDTGNYTGLTRTITIPDGQAAGDYVLRVKVQQVSDGDPCGNMVYGEVEDYTVSVIETPSCLDVTDITYTSAGTDGTSSLVSWTETGTATDYNIEVYEAGADTSTATAVYTEAVVGATSTTVTGLTAYTYYDAYVQADCGLSGQAVFVMQEIYTGHCDPASNNIIVYINDVTTTGGATNISNTASGFSAGGYGDFRTQAITGLVETQSFDVAFVNDGTYGGRMYAWVDWNNDLSFDNTAGSSEIVYTADDLNYGSGSFTVTIPDGQAAGDFVLRVKVQQSSDGEPCGDMIYGEVEDYTISVSEACSWNGATSTDWATASNWSTGAAPTSSDTVLINGTFTNEPLISSTDATAGKVILATGNTLTIDETSSLTVSGDFTNTGTVTLNSTADDFSSLIVTGTATGDITYNRYVNVYDDSAGGGWDLVCSPVDMTIADFITANGANIEVLGDDYAFAQFNNATGQWERYATDTNTGSFTSGQGYSMATTTGATVAFTGAMQTTDQSINIINNDGLNNVGRRWNLVSNPFPSYIAGNTDAGGTNFIDANSSVIDSEFLAVYGWTGSDYTIYNNLSGAFSMAPGQGFWVAAASTSDAALDFTAAMRTTTGTGDFVSGPQLLTYNVGLKLYNGEIERAATNFYFRDGLTLGLDPGYDAAAYNQSTKLSSRLAQGSQETAFAINAMAIDDLQNTRVPLEIRQNAGQAFTISISDMELPQDISVYLEDTLNGTFTSLNDGDFELTAQSNLSGADRFFIVFKDNSVLSSGDTLGINALNVYKANTDSFVTIAGITPDLGKLNATLYNIIGATVREKALNTATATQRLSTQGLASGLYIIQLRSGNQVFTKKIIVE